MTKSHDAGGSPAAGSPGRGRTTRPRSAVGERLGRYIGDEPGKVMSIRSFADAMGKREPRPTGSTRAMVHRYLDGVTPPLDFIEAAASILKLRVEYLTFGNEPPTEEEERAAMATGATATGVDPLGLAGRLLAERILDELGLPADFSIRARFGRKTGLTGFQPWLLPLIEAWRRRYLAASALAGHTPPEQREEDAAADIARAVVAPLHELGLKVVSREMGWFEDYVIALAPALTAICDSEAVPVRGRTEEEQREGWQERMQAYAQLRRRVKQRSAPRTATTKRTRKEG